MADNNRFAIIPEDVMYCNTIKYGSRLLYADILRLSKSEGYCFATNSYFADKFETTGKTIDRWMKELRDAKLIRSEGEKIGFITKRKIFCTTDKNVYAPQTKMSKPIDNNDSCSIDKNVAHNITIGIVKINIKAIGTKHFYHLKEIEELSEFSEFGEVIKIWLCYQKEKKKELSRSTILLTLQKWKKLGVHITKLKVEKAIANNWNGWDYQDDKYSSPESNPKSIDEHLKSMSR